jgi:uncharacterized protein
VTDHYLNIADLPKTLKVFPLRGVIMLPRSSLPLNVFEPRYLTLVNDTLAGDRLIGVVQPLPGAGKDESPEGSNAPLHRTGGCGRITAFQETDDGRYLITLSGIARFNIAGEEQTDAPYRVCNVDWSPFEDDLRHGFGEEAVDRDRLLSVLREYLTVNDLSADWDGINNSSNELLINTLSMISPYGAEEKQALLEADDLKSRAQVLVALAEMELAGSDSDSGSTLQ